MARIEINSEALIPWCDRRGLDASRIVAEAPQEWRADDGIHYRLRQHVPGTSNPERWSYVEVVAPFGDPMPPVWVVAS